MRTDQIISTDIHSKLYTKQWGQIRLSVQTYTARQPGVMRTDQIIVLGKLCFARSGSRGWLGGLVVKSSASRAEDPGFESRLRRDFSGSSHTSDFKIGTPMATLPGAWRYRVSAGIGWPGVSILWLGVVESLIRSLSRPWVPEIH